MSRLTPDQNITNGYMSTIVIIAFFIYDIIRNLMLRKHKHRFIVAVVIVDLIIIALGISLMVLFAYLKTLDQNTMAFKDYFTMRVFIYIAGAIFVFFRTVLEVGEPKN